MLRISGERRRKNGSQASDEGAAVHSRASGWTDGSPAEVGLLKSYFQSP